MLRYGVCLVGAKRDDANSRIMLNPGHSFTIQPDDNLYYMALSREESLSRFLKKRIGKKMLPETVSEYGSLNAIVKKFLVEILDSSPKKAWKSSHHSHTEHDIKNSNELTPLVKSTSTPLPNPFLTMFFAEKLKKGPHCDVCNGTECIEKE